MDDTPLLESKTGVRMADQRYRKALQFRHLHVPECESLTRHQGWCPFGNCPPFEGVHYGTPIFRARLHGGRVEARIYPRRAGRAGGQRAGAGRRADCAAQRSRAGPDPGISADGAGARGARSAAGSRSGDPAACAIAQLCVGGWSLVVERHAISLAAGRPSVSATFMPGHWEQQANGWVWVEGRWAYPGVGSSTPPAWYPSAR
jgi:hypothetical protein